MVPRLPRPGEAVAFGDRRAESNAVEAGRQGLGHRVHRPLVAAAAVEEPA